MCTNGNTWNWSKKKWEGTENTFNMWSISTRPQGKLAISSSFCSQRDTLAAESLHRDSILLVLISNRWCSDCRCDEGTALSRDTSWCMFSFLTLTGRSIRRVFPHRIPSSCSSACCPTQAPRLLISGRLQAKTTTLRSGSPSTVSHPSSCFRAQLEGGDAALADPT